MYGDLSHDSVAITVKSTLINVRPIDHQFCVESIGLQFDLDYLPEPGDYILKVSNRREQSYIQKISNEELMQCKEELEKVLLNKAESSCESYQQYLLEEIGNEAKYLNLANPDCHQSSAALLNPLQIINQNRVLVNNVPSYEMTVGIEYAILMPKFRGITLYAFRKQCLESHIKYRFSVLIDFCLSILNAVEKMGINHVIHGDLTSDNILVDWAYPKLLISIVDTGCACIEGGFFKTSMTESRYWSPDRCVANTNIEAKTYHDVYALLEVFSCLFRDCADSNDLLQSNQLQHQLNFIKLTSYMGQSLSSLRGIVLAHQNSATLSSNPSALLARPQFTDDQSLWRVSPK